MKTVRVYKVNVRQHIFRSLFFTDRIIFLCVGIGLALGIFILYKFIFHFFQYGLFVSTVFIAELFLAMLATIKIESQPIYLVIPRALLHIVAKKKYATEELDQTTSDFSIVGNYLVRKKQLIGVYEIMPFDIALLNDEEREQFYFKMKTMLHTLPGKVQILVRKETAKPSDYQDHFFSLYKNAKPKQEALLRNYISDVTSLLELKRFQMVKYYAVFSTPLQTNKEKDFVNACQKLFDMGSRLSSALALANIPLRQLEKTELITYFQAQFRNL